MSSSKIIVFDLDGVLFDSTALVSEFFFSMYPSMTKERMDEILKGNFHEELAKFKAGNKPIEETPEEHKQRNAEYSVKKANTPLYSGIKEMLEKLHAKNYRLVINTSAMKKNCIPLLERAGVLEYFDFVATKEDGVLKTDKFRLIAEKYNVSPTDLIFITDTVGDIVEAEELDVPTIAVTWGAHESKFFSERTFKNLISIIHSVNELENVLSNR